MIGYVGLGVSLVVMWPVSESQRYAGATDRAPVDPQVISRSVTLWRNMMGFLEAMI